MGKSGHLPWAALSALADGELEGHERREADAHLAGCAECLRTLEELSRLDERLALTPALTCAASAELRSALHDGELSEAERGLAAAHLRGCAACAADAGRWSTIEAAVRALPAGTPSAAVDARIARLTAPASRRTGPPHPLGVPALRAVGLRAGLAAVLLLAVISGSLPSAPTTPFSGQAGNGVVLVASVQEMAFFSTTNTLYVLQPADAALDAMDATTYALRTRIHIGGTPRSLAADEAGQRLFVLDAEQRALVEIDAQRNAVVASTPIDFAGTPTSVQVGSGGQIIVTAIPDPPITSSPQPTATPTAGVVAVIDGSTKLVQSVQPVDVAPQLVVNEPSGKRALLVSTGGTTLVDASYRTLRKLPGGVAGAFSAGGLIAVLSGDPNAAVLHLFGDGAPGPLRLEGVPIAVTPVPDVGVAVLLGSGSGNGRIVVVDEAGRAVGSSEVARVGRDLAYDPTARRFAVNDGGKVASAPLPRGLPVARPDATSSPIQGGIASPLPSLSALASPVPSATPSPAVSGPGASPSPGASASPTASGTRPSIPSSTPRPAPTRAPDVPAAALLVGEGLYRVDLGGRIPRITASGMGRVWFVDQRGALSWLDVTSGDVLTIAKLPADADITVLAAGKRSVYAIDARAHRLFMVSLKDAGVTSQYMPYLDRASSVAEAGGRVWIGIRDHSELLSLDPRKGSFELVPAGVTGIASMATDGQDRLWYADGDQRVASLDPVSRTVEVLAPLPATGSARHVRLAPDGAVWAATTRGEVIAIRGGSARLALDLGRPISGLSVDYDGVVWYYAPAPLGTAGVSHGSLGGGAARTVPAAALSLDISPAGRAWLADPLGGFYLSVPGTP